MSTTSEDQGRVDLTGLAEHLPQLLWSATRDSGLDWLGPRWAEVVDVAALRLDGRNPLDLVHPQDRAALVEAWAAGEASGRLGLTIRLLVADGGYRRFAVDGRRAGDAAGDRWFGSCVDVTAQHEAAEELLIERSRWELLTASTPGVIVAFEPLRPDGVGELNIIYASERCEEILGFSREEVLSRPQTLRDRMNPEDLADVIPAMIAGARAEPQERLTLEYDTRYEHPTRGERMMESRAVGAPMPDGTYRWQVTVTDATEQRAARAALHAEKERAEVTLASIGDAVITTDAHARVTYLNPVAEGLTGWTTDQAEGRPVDEVLTLFSESTGEPVESPAIRCLREGRPVGLASHTALRDRAGRLISVEDSSAPIRDAHGVVLGAVLVFHDVSDAKALTRALAHQASHDALTGLVNRTEFERHLNTALDDARHGIPSAVLYLDLDQFKVVNDSDGHVAGDALLCTLAGVLQSQVRATDTVARLGGDEFGIILRGCAEEQAVGLAQNLCDSVAAERFEWEHRVHRVGVSIGLVSLGRESGTAAEVLRVADSACYLAKEAGRGRLHVAHGDDERARRRHGELGWVRRLQDVIEHHEVVLWAQPILPARAGEDLPSLEILLRLQDDTGRLAAPGEFLPAAERYQMAGALDRVVVESTLRWFAERPQVLAQIRTCSINLSGDSVGDSETMTFIDGLFDELGLDGEHFCFEVTETAVIADLEDTSRFLGTLRARGCQVALDDFGVGLSSFSYLRTLPVDVLKIDGTFVRRVREDPVDEVMVRSIHQVGHLLGKRTVAEYVENDEIRRAVTEIGVDLLQGFGVGRPGPLAQVIEELLGADLAGSTTEDDAARG
ncbi:EAL domain-containing protein [Actinotalea sp.]|uniref:bifunctional diguanylate cyclase/phosphodiesterase n=1 Tax=Actinotalea sp. TaxID=1872145 RepID=UPI00356B537D